ncbi:MAG: histone deacetylase family protein [Anaerolineales bacterium]
MKIFYAATHSQHNPAFEVFDGGRRVPYLENPDRMEKILAALRQTDWAEFSAPSDFGLAPIESAHDEDYLNFLATCWDEWQTSDPQISAAPQEHPFLPATFALRRTPRKPVTLLAKGGYYLMDLSACIVQGTYRAALGSANCALSAAEFAANENARAFALCRPPGHHAGRDYAAGYCFLNNAAIAANFLSARGRVAVLDIDYHAGNGTQDIFYERADVLTISIHADPQFEYPHFIGFADEIGAGAGRGFHRNFPLAAGATDAQYLAALDEALSVIHAFAPRYLVLSAGMDTFSGDPLGTFQLTRAGFAEIGKRIAALALPAAIVMEGGYANAALGENIKTLLESF